MSESFRFKQFEIDQEGAAQKVGTDSVLLGSWIKQHSCKSVLDIGCGTGILALMMAQRFPEALIDAVEIDETAYGCAVKNAENSVFQNRVSVYHQKIQDFNPDRTYDLIITNPPFFSGGHKSPTLQRSVARHNDTLTHEELLSVSALLLNEKGALNLILPVKEADSFSLKAVKYGLYKTGICNVIPIPDKAPNRVMLTLKKETTNQLSVEKIVLRNTDRTYSEAYKSLTKDFYLNL
ncbi:tRNA1(Val) (adenine(37)-N6)-methyltransferase [Saccharicrinis sp. FJH2]|uniref:tRNA1(Val) (adenine(37)-N6)-methyltransferase n=1 Tax=unclassified Saccharicrinis TaxID=2646859 RepID=UPI0035D4EBF7